MRRKADHLVPLEIAICDAAGRLTAYGTLYRALGRLESMGLLSSGAASLPIPMTLMQWPTLRR